MLKNNPGRPFVCTPEVEDVLKWQNKMTCRLAADRFLMTSTCVWCVSLKNAKIIWGVSIYLINLRRSWVKYFGGLLKSLPWRQKSGHKFELWSWRQRVTVSTQRDLAVTLLSELLRQHAALAQTLNALKWLDDWLHPQRSNGDCLHFSLNNKPVCILGEINQAALWWDWSVLFAESQPLHRDSRALCWEGNKPVGSKLRCPQCLRPVNQSFT